MRVEKAFSATILSLAGTLCILGAALAGRAAGPSPASLPATEAAFTLTSPVAKDGAELPKEFTGDGAGISPPIEWTNAPAGTKSFAIIMHHVAPDQTKWYWIVYNIPPETKSLPKNVKDVGTLGNNSTNHKTEYLPPHSKGPGAKTYIITIYALSAPPKITVPAAEVGRDTLLAAMKDLILASAELHVTYTRFPEPDRTDGPPPPPGARGTGSPFTMWIPAVAASIAAVLLLFAWPHLAGTSWPHRSWILPLALSLASPERRPPPPAGPRPPGASPAQDMGRRDDAGQMRPGPQPDRMELVVAEWTRSAPQ